MQAQKEGLPKAQIENEYKEIQKHFIIHQFDYGISYSKPLEAPEALQFREIALSQNLTYQALGEETSAVINNLEKHEALEYPRVLELTEKAYLNKLPPTVYSSHLNEIMVNLGGGTINGYAAIKITIKQAEALFEIKQVKQWSMEKLEQKFDAAIVRSYEINVDKIILRLKQI